jgi:hypothetical protein
VAQSQEERVAASSYVISFYKFVQSLTHEYANYENMLLEMEAKTKNNAEKLDPTSKDTLLGSSQRLRYYATQTYINYESIRRAVGDKKIKENADMRAAYAELRSHLIIARDDAEKFVVEMNAILLTEIVKNLLQTSQDVMEQLYGTADQPAQ